MNKMVDHFRYSTFIPRQDRPHDVYIFLKLRAFCIHAQQEKGFLRFIIFVQVPFFAVFSLEMYVACSQL